MATARVEDELLKCPICFEHFDQPRQLPDCLHVFCENCLLTFIGNVKSDDDFERRFQCPVCRKQVSVPFASTELSEWVKSLKLNLDMESKSNTKGLLKDSVCSPCKETEKIVSAEKFCFDCQEYLCKCCSGIIHSLKLLKTHCILDMETGTESEETDLTRMLTNYFTCSRHSDKTVTHICHEDDDLCCINCIIENHRHCEGVTELKDPVTHSNTKTDVSKVKGQIQNGFLQIKAITDFRKDNMTENKEKIELINVQVREIRTKLNTVFDALEESIQSETKALAKSITIDADNESKALEVKKKRLTAFLSLVEKIETEGSDSQMFVILYNIRSKIIEIEEEIREVGNNCSRHELSLQITEKLNGLMKVSPNDSSELATIKEGLSEVTLPNCRKKVSLLNSRAEKIAEHDIELKPSPVGSPTYCGVSTYHKSQLILTDNYNLLCCLTDNSYKATATCRLKENYGIPFCVTNVKHALIAISIPKSQRICFLSIQKDPENIHIIGSVNTRLTPKALFGMKNGNIAVSWNNPVAFGILAFSCNFYVPSYKEKVFLDHDTAGRSFKSFDYMAVDEERSHVIQPCKTDNAVYCFDFCGNPKFSYKHEKLACPNGVACDGQGNIYICDQSSSSIHVVSAEGVGTRVITEGCPRTPLAIAFHSDGIQFAVTNNGSPWSRLTIFKLSQETESS